MLMTGPCQFLLLQRAPIVEPISQTDARAVNGGQRIHGVARAPSPARI